MATIPKLRSGVWLDTRSKSVSLGYDGARDGARVQAGVGYLPQGVSRHDGSADLL